MLHHFGGFAFPFFIIRYYFLLFYLNKKYRSKGGPSGWTCELLLPLLGYVVCADGIATFVEDCCIGSHDPHSGHLIRSSLMAAANKRNPDKKRTLMMGEIWAKLASKYSKALDISNFIEVFEPIKTAVGAQGGQSVCCRQRRRQWNSVLLM
jgi:hypothetical protein